MSTTIHVADGNDYRVLSDLTEVEPLLAQPGVVIWIDTDEQGTQVSDFLRDHLHIHPLAIEDIFEEQVIPKVEDYGDYLYIVMQGIHRDSQDIDSLLTVDIDIAFGQNWIFTHHGFPMRSVDAVREELKRNPRVLQRGPAYVAHGIVDHLTDHYRPVADQFDDELDWIDKAVLEDPSRETLARVFVLKRALMRLRRVTAYQREILQRLSRGEFELIPERALPFFRDVYDHFARIADVTDNYREQISSAIEVHVSMVANRTNDIMKVLAIISTIMLPLTFIAGVYGMNFEYMPELKWAYGYPWALLLMAITAGAFLAYFRRKRWI